MTDRVHIEVVATRHPFASQSLVNWYVGKYRDWYAELVNGIGGPRLFIHLRHINPDSHEYEHVDYLLDTSDIVSGLGNEERHRELFDKARKSPPLTLSQELAFHFDKLFTKDIAPDPAAELARLFHETYEALAPQHGYETREASRVPWEDVPANNQNLMIATAREVLKRLR